MTERVSEQAVLLGSRQSLVGIITREVTSAPANQPAVVILNTGIVHRVGHHRMYVTMARALAQSGLMVLRFDFSGIGDSDPRIDGLSPLESCMADIKEALDWLERERGVSQIILAGLCSGADHAILYGHTDPRVKGLVLMDPSMPATARYYLQYIPKRMTRLRNWGSVLSGRSRIARMWLEQALYTLRPRWRAGQVTLRDLQFRAYLGECYQNSVDHGIQMLAVLTGDLTRQTYRRQMLDAFPKVSFGTQLQLELFPGSDHTFSREADRTRLLALILGWIDRVHNQAGPQAPGDAEDHGRVGRRAAS